MKKIILETLLISLLSKSIYSVKTISNKSYNAKQIVFGVPRKALSSIKYFKDINISYLLNFEFKIKINKTYRYILTN